MKKHLSAAVFMTLLVLIFAASNLSWPAGGFDAYAPPNVWGPWKKIQSHGGSATFEISAEPLGDTRIRCRVRYWVKYKDNIEQVVEEFVDDVKITTANVWGNIEVSFMGTPLGTAVRGSIVNSR